MKAEYTGQFQYLGVPEQQGNIGILEKKMETAGTMGIIQGFYRN